MTSLNAVLVWAADAMLGPLQALPPLAVLLVLAFVTALVVLGVMKVASDQAAMAAVKQQIHADLLEMRLYNDDVRALLRAQGALLRHNGAYLWRSLVPVLITAVPLTLAIAQLQSWYGYSGLPVGAPALVTVGLRGGTPPALPALDAPEMDVEGGAAYFPTLHEVVWRVVPRVAGPHTVSVQVDGEPALHKAVHVGDAIARRSPAREPAGLWQQLLYPSEPPVPAGSAVAAVRVEYATRELSVLGVDVHWLIVYLAASFVFVIALRKPFGVVI